MLFQKKKRTLINNKNEIGISPSPHSRTPKKTKKAAAYTHPSTTLLNLPKPKEKAVLSLPITAGPFPPQSCSTTIRKGYVPSLLGLLVRDFSPEGGYVLCFLLLTLFYLTI